MGEAERRHRRRHDPAADLSYARAAIEAHERGIADLERAISDRRQTIEHWRAVVAKLEASPADAGPGGEGVGDASMGVCG